MGIGSNIEDANSKVLEIMLGAEPVWVDIKPAIEVIPGMKENMILHAGPPLEWDKMCGVQRNGIIGGILHQGLAKTREESASLVEDGKIELAPANDHMVVGAGVGIVCARMYMIIVKDKTSNKEGYCFPVEGPYRGGLGGWGVYNEKIEENLQLLENVLCPILSKVLKKCGGINVKNIIAKGTQMGDESHSRQVAEGLLLVNELMPSVVRLKLDWEKIVQCVDFLTKTERFFHHISMAAAMSILQAAAGVDYSTVVTAMGGNGVEYGIKISALPGKWFTAPAPMIEGKYFSAQWGPENAIPWLGDSCVVEAVGLGGFAAAAGPAVLQLRGGTTKDAIRQTEEMRQICVGTNRHYPIPLMDFEGPPIGIDIRKVLETGIAPVSHGGIISKEGGQIGAGITKLPMECFKKALYAFAEKYGV